MKCINPPSPPLSLTNKHTIWPRRLQLTGTGTATGTGNGFSLTSRALPCIFVAATAPPSAKLSVLLQTGGVCLVAYWIANFVVPGFVLKDLQSKEKADENPTDDEG